MNTPRLLPPSARNNSNIGIKSNPVIICISVKKYILPNLCKCPSHAPDESTREETVLNNPIDDAFVLLF